MENEQKSIIEILVDAEQEAGRDKGKSEFRIYKNKKEIGTLIFKSFKNKITKNGTFYIADNYKKVGLISNLMGLSTLLDLDSMGVEDMETNFEKFYELVKQVFNAIYKNGKVVFDPSPYMEQEYIDRYEFYSYVETASKVVSTMVDFREFALTRAIAKMEFPQEKYTLNGKEIKTYYDLASIIENLIMDAVRFLYDACLPLKEPVVYKINNKEIDRNGFDKMIKWRGWAFQKPKNNDEADEYSTSIYYTYYASNAFISVYSTYPTLFERILNDKADDENEQKTITIKTEKEELDEKFIYNNKSLLNAFKVQVSSSARYIEQTLRKKEIDLAFDYFRNGFIKVTATDIFQSDKNNHIIDMLFTIGILIYGGIDEDYEYVKNGSEFFNDIQSAIANIKKIYNSRKSINQDDSVGSYRLVDIFYQDKYPSAYNEMVREFRTQCEPIGVYDYVPLLCNVYTKVSDFLIKYPQREMMGHLELILDNCDQKNWLWPKRGYNINNNLYYIFALENFYDYYYQYEEPFIDNQRKYNELKDNVKREQDKATILANDYEQKLQEKDVEKGQLIETYENKLSDLDAAVLALVKKYVDAQLKETVHTVLAELMKDFYDFAVEALDVNDKKALLENHPGAKTVLELSNATHFVNYINKKDGEDLDAITDKNALRLKIKKMIFDAIEDKLK